MIEFKEPEFGLGTIERDSAGRQEVCLAMRDFIASAVSVGWLECEVTMLLADAADDHVIALAEARRKNAKASRPATNLRLVK